MQHGVHVKSSNEVGGLDNMCSILVTAGNDVDWDINLM